MRFPAQLILYYNHHPLHAPMCYWLGSYGVLSQTLIMKNVDDNIDKQGRKAFEFPGSTSRPAQCKQGKGENNGDWFVWGANR